MNNGSKVAARVKRHQERKREAGLKPIYSLWAYPEDHQTIREFAKKLTDARKPLDKR